MQGQRSNPLRHTRGDNSNINHTSNARYKLGFNSLKYDVYKQN